MGSTYLKSDGFIRFQRCLDELYALFDKLSFKIDKQELSQAFKELVGNLSSQITNRSKKLYARLSDEALLEKNDLFNHFVAYSNQLTYLVSQSILQQDKRSKRVLCYELWTYVLNECVLNGDLTGATSVYTGLSAYFMSRYVKRHQISLEAQHILDQFSKIYQPLLTPSHTFNLQKRYLDQARSEEILMIPQLSGIMGSIASGKQVFNDNKDILKKLSQEKKQVETKLKKLHRKLKHHKSLKKEAVEDFITTLDEIAIQINQLKSEYEQILKAFDGNIPDELSQTTGISIILNFINTCHEINQNQLSHELTTTAHEKSSTSFHIRELINECRDIDDLDMIADFAKEHCSEAKNKAISKKITKYIEIDKVLIPQKNSKKRISPPDSMSFSDLSLTSKINDFFKNIDMLYLACTKNIKKYSHEENLVSLSSVSIFNHDVEGESPSEPHSHRSEDNESSMLELK